MGGDIIGDAAFALTPHVGAPTAGALGLAPQVGALIIGGAELAGENVTGSEEIARGFANGMTLLAA